MSEFLTYVQLQFVSAQKRCSRQKKSGNRWPNNDKLLALSIYCHSAKAYRFLLKLFALPSVFSLRRWIRDFRLIPGHNDRVFNVLRMKLSQMKENDHLCIVTFDEMSK